MTITSFNQSPYFDDFSTPDVNGNTVSDKNYHRILFQPGYGVQTRELNQLQSILQDQIDKFGKSIYVDGTKVIDGVPSFVNNVFYVDVDITDDTVLTALTGIKGIKKSATTLSATVLSVEEKGDYYRMWVRYDSASGSTKRFSVSDEIVLKDGTLYLEDLEDVEITTVIGTVQDLGYGFSVNVSPGVYFVKGSFVHTPQQSKYFEKTSEVETVTGEVIFVINETIKTYKDDETLLDNALGKPNYSSPGADRYVIELQLAFLTDDADILSLNTEDVYEKAAANLLNYTSLLEVSQNNVYVNAKTEYSQLDNLLAQRTFDESGNYTVNPFVINIREFYNSGSGNNGVYTSSQITTNQPFGVSTVSEARDNFIIEIEPSVAYIKGYRIELAEKKPLKVLKSIETNTVSDTPVTASRGNYVDVVYDPAGSSPTSIQDMFDLTGFGQNIRNIEFNGVISASEAEGTTGGRTGYHRYKLYIQSKFDGTLPTGFEYRYVPGTIGGTPVDDTEIKSANLKSAMYVLPYKDVQTITGLTYEKQKTIQGAFDSGQTYDFPCASIESFDANIIPEDVVIYNATTGKYLNPADEIDTLTVGTNTVAILFNSTGNITFGTDNIYITTSVTVTSDGTDNRRTKTFTNVVDDAYTTPASQVIVIDDQDVLIDTITVTDSVTSGEVSYRVIDSGINSSFYDSPVIYVNTTNNVLISYSYFTHSSGDFFTVDSYPDNPATIEFADYPFFRGSRISDFVDFRVKRSRTLNVDQYDYEIVSPAVTKVIPNSLINVESSEYRLPRKDILVVDSKGEFSVVTGEPAFEPKSPNTPSDTVKLYDIYVPAIVQRIQDIRWTYVDNRRYTMKDIQGLEKRIENIEYYTTLSLLEKEATDKRIFDLSEENAGVERFKNGILVDSFTNHTLGDITDEDYRCAIDTENGILRPYFEKESFRLKYNDIVDGSAKNTSNPGEVGEETLTLDEGDRSRLVQNDLYTETISVQPYELTEYPATLKLSPSSDEWIDTETAPPVNVDLGQNDVWEALDFIAQQNVPAVEWNDWTTQLIGKSVDQTTEVSGGETWPTIFTDEFGTGALLETTTTTTQNTFQSSRTGIQTILELQTQSAQRSLGNRVVDIKTIPWIRSRDVNFIGHGFKPNTTLYAFFDGVDVTDYVKPATYVPFGSSTDVSTYTGSGAPGGDFNNPLVTDANGNVEGVFRIPNNDTTRFRTGQRTFKLTDSDTNSSTESDTSGIASYNAEGLLSVQGDVQVETRFGGFATSEVTVSESRTFSTVESVVSRRRFDPVAQTFFIQDDKPDGVFLSDIEIFFAQKPTDTTIGVEGYLVQVENGLPTTKVVPGSKVFLENSQVTTNPGGRTPASNENVLDYGTTFEFEYPVYLKPSTEYAFVVFSLSRDYRIWSSVVGQTDLRTDQRITNNPSLGTLLKSSNRRTWTPDQTRDMTIRFNQATFTVDTPKTFEFTTKIGGDKQGMDSFVFNLFNLFFETTKLPSTSIKYDLGFYNTSGVLIDSVFSNINTKENYRLIGELSSVAHEIKVDVTLETTNSDVTPLIDLERCSVIGVSNYISDADMTQEGGVYDPVAKTWGTGVYFGGDETTSRYITRKVSMVNTSEDLRVLIAVNRPSEGSNVRVFAKRKSANQSDSSFTGEVQWFEMILYSVNSDINRNQIPVRDNPDSFDEIEYIADLPYITDPAIGDEGFTEYAIKIVFTSDDTTYVPTVRDLRSIASA